jgi:hypothetical protein
MKKQTAVEWLVKQLKNMEYDLRLIPNTIEIAKEKEKQQMRDAVLSQCTTHDGLRKIFDKQFEQYYNETFKSK